MKQPCAFLCALFAFYVCHAAAPQVEACREGDESEDRYQIDTGFRAGQLRFRYNFYSVPDRARIYYEGKLLYSTGEVGGSDDVLVDYGPGTSTSVVIVINEGGGQDGTAWQYCAIATPSELQMTFHKLGRSGLQYAQTDNIDAPLQPRTNPDLLKSSADLFDAKGMVADGVTPLLVKFERQVNASDAEPKVFEITTSCSGGSVANFPSKLRILNEGVWSQSASISMEAEFGYAYVIPLTQGDLSFDAGSTEIAVTLTATETGSAEPIAVATFYVRRPPVVLVHGYNADAETWSSNFRSRLELSRPSDFVLRVNYGTLFDSDVRKIPNTIGSFRYLAADLDRQLDYETAYLSTEWAFTRYDVVGHSQGGVLLRMLCQMRGDGTAAFAAKPVVSSDTFYRGRFNRVITIGSPHNGSTLLRYLLRLAENEDFAALISHMGSLIQPKFDPFGDQIRAINEPVIPVDARIKFHCIRTRIASGSAPVPEHCPIGYRALGLCSPPPGEVVTRGQELLPSGSDGVVDYTSQGGGAGTKSTALSVDVSHANVPFVFGVPFGHSQTAYSVVASKVVDLLDGPASSFGPFFLPVRLSESTRARIDELTPTVTQSDAIWPPEQGETVFGQSLVKATMIGGATSTGTNILVSINEEAVTMIDGEVSWIAQVMSPDGVSTEGVSITPGMFDNDSAVISIAPQVEGDVLVLVTFIDAYGRLVISTPLRVYSTIVNRALAGIQVEPAHINMEVGDNVPLGLWGVYSNGFRVPLFLSRSSNAFINSSAPSIVDRSTGAVFAVDGNGAGSATLSVIFEGHEALVPVNVLQPGLPQIVNQPSGAIVRQNGNAVFSVSASGSVPMHYQWMFQGQALVGQTNSFLELQAGTQDAGLYHVLITNAAGSATSTLAHLIVERWRYHMGDSVVSSPAIDDEGWVYATSMSTNVVALSAADGTVRWQFQTSNSVVASPVVSRHSVYVAGLDGNLYALSTTNGSVLWQQTADVPFRGGPAVRSDGRIVVTSLEQLLMINGNTGAIEERTDLPGSSWSSPSLVTDTLALVGATDGYLYGLKIGSDDPVRYFETYGWVVGPPAVDQSFNAYFGSYDNVVRAVDVLWGDVLWEVDMYERIAVSPIITHDNKVLVGSADGTVLALDKSDGSYLWETLLTGAVASTAAEDGTGTVYIGSHDGRLYALNGNDGTYKWHFQTTGAVRGSPSIGSDGTIYFGSDDGYIYALYPGSNGTSSGEWPSFGQNAQHHARATTAEGISPVILGDLGDKYVGYGSTVNWYMAVLGSEPLSFQWFYEDEPLAGQTNSYLSLENCSDAMEGYYYAHVTNAYGEAWDDVGGYVTVVPSVIAANATLREGNGGITNLVFPIAVRGNFTDTLTVYFAAYPEGDWQYGDFIGTNGQITVGPGTTNVSLVIWVRGDTEKELDQRIVVDLYSYDDALVSPSTVFGLIVNDDGLPGNIHGFEWVPVPNPQSVGIPFRAIIAARDYSGAIASNYNGSGTINIETERQIGVTDYYTTYGTLFEATKHRTQIIYSPEEIGAATVLSGLQYFIAEADGRVLSNLTVRLRHCVLSNFYSGSGWEDLGFTTVFKSDVSLTNSGWITFLFNETFAFNGIENLLVDISYSGSSESGPLETATTDYVYGGRTAHYGISANTFGDPLAWVGQSPTPLLEDYIPITRFLFASPSNWLGAIIVGPFTNGLWSGELVIERPADNIHLLISDGDGHTGRSGVFDVLQTNDLSVNLEAVSNVDPFQEVNYRIHAVNTGPQSSSSVIVTNVLPSNTTFITAVPSQGACWYSNGILVCFLGQLEPDSQATVNVAITARLANTAMTNLVTVVRSEPDPDVSNNVAFQRIIVGSPELVIQPLVLPEHNTFKEVIFPVNLNGPSARDISFTYSTQDGTAIYTDYAGTNGICTIPIGSTNGSISLRVYGDAHVEQDEVFYVNFQNIIGAKYASGAGEVVLLNDDGRVGEMDRFVWDPVPSAQSIKIPFNVVLSARDISNNLVTNFNGTATLRASSSAITVGAGAQASVIPMGVGDHDLRTQVIYLADELGSQQLLTSLSLNVIEAPGLSLSNWTIRMKHTSLSNYTPGAAWETSGWITVFQQNVTIPGAGWILFPFTAPFAYNGSNNVIVDFSFNNSSYSYGGDCIATTVGTSRTLHYGTDSIYGDPLTWSSNRPAGIRGSVVPNVRFGTAAQNIVSPGETLPFINGYWRGPISLLNTGFSGMRLIANDGDGHFGYSDPIEVLSANDVKIGVSGTNYLPANGSATLFVNVFNPGPQSATQVIISNTVPTNVSIASVTISQGACIVTNRVILCTVPTLAPMASCTLEVSVKAAWANSSGILAASVSRGEDDGSIVNNMFTHSVNVGPPTLALGALSSPEGHVGSTLLAFNLSLSSPSASPVVVRVNTSDGTASSNIDYAATNGLVTFPAGSTNINPVLRVLGDRNVEPNESFTVHVTPQGPPSVVLSTNATIVTIVNDDGLPGDIYSFQVNPVAPQLTTNEAALVSVRALDYFGAVATNFNGVARLRAIVPVTDCEIGTGDSVTEFPMGSYFEDERTQVIYTSHEMKGPQQYAGLALNVVSAPPQILNRWTIRMKHTAASNYSVGGHWETNGWVTVVQTNVSQFTNGWMVFPFTAPFDYNGSNGLLVDFSFNNNTYTRDGFCAASAKAGGFKTQYFRSDSDHGDPLLWSGLSPTPQLSLYTPDVRFIASVPFVSMWPTNAAFTNGEWSGLVVFSSSTTATLLVEDEFGHAGESHPFQVVNALPPRIASQSNSRTVIGPTNVDLVVSAVGSQPLNYQWRSNGIPIPSAGASSFHLANVTRKSSATYDAVVTNLFGGVTSAPITVRVIVPSYLSSMQPDPGSGRLVASLYDLVDPSAHPTNSFRLQMYSSTNLIQWWLDTNFVLLPGGFLSIPPPKGPVQFFRVRER